jgi:hypothetical protein
MTTKRDRVALTPQASSATGQTVLLRAPEPAPPAPWPAVTRDLALVESGEIVSISEPGASPVHVSRLPRARMAAATWEDIARTLGTAEDGKPGSVDVELRPGGQLVLTGREQVPQPLSQLPAGRMA